jgi:hypothetical protein
VGRKSIPLFKNKEKVLATWGWQILTTLLSSNSWKTALVNFKPADAAGR